MQVGAPNGDRRERAYNARLRAESPAGSRDSVPG